VNFSIQQSGGGVGFSFSRLRHKGDRVQKSAGVASGPVSFLKVYDVALSSVTQVAPVDDNQTYKVGDTVIGAAPVDFQVARGPIEFMDVYNSAFTAIAQGGCLVPDTLVSTSRGMLRLNELVNSNTLGWQQWAEGQEISVATDDGIHNSPCCFNNGIADTIKVTTACGMEIIGTPNHRVKIMTDKGPDWKCLSELKAGDDVAFYINTLSENGFRHTMQQFTTPLPECLPNITFPDKMTDELAFVIGYLHGNGTIGDDGKGTSFSVLTSSCLVTDFPNILDRVFKGVSYTIMTRNKTSVYELHSLVGQWFAMNNITDRSYSETSVPFSIRAGPASVVLSYLAGIYEANAIFSYCRPTMTIASKKIAKDAHVLLFALGCPCYIAKNRTAAGVYNIHFTDSGGQRMWLQKINALPFINPCNAHAPHHRFTDADGLPYVLPNTRWWFGDVLTKSKNKELCRLLEGYIAEKVPLTECSLYMLFSFSDFAEYGRAPGHLWFSSVISTKPNGLNLTLDLEVDDNHTYIANGMVTHNTRRGASMGVLRVDHPDILEFIRCKSDQTKLNGFNISVGITDDFIMKMNDNLPYDLISPRDGHVVGTLNARDVMNEIAKNACHNGEPGVLFLDRINQKNPVPHLYKIETTNPCVTADTVVMTSTGPKFVRELIGVEFNTHEGSLVKDGFFLRGLEPIITIKTNNGHSLRCSRKHCVLNGAGRWVEARKLLLGDELMRYNGDNETIVFIGDPFITGGDVIQENVYDCTVRSNYHCYVSNGFFSHNCGEQALGPNESCCLGSINLAKHIKWQEGELYGTVDWDKLSTTIANAVRFLDDVITVNRYVPAIPELREAAWKSRRIGLGYMGLADMLMALGYRYGSSSALTFVTLITSAITTGATMASIELAKERGPFPAIQGSIFDPKHITWEPYGTPVDQEMMVLLKRYGIRNAAVTTLAPTGTIGTVAGVEGYGIEPVFALSYSRRVMQPDGTTHILKYASPLFARACAICGIEQDSPAYKEVLEKGSCQGVVGIPEILRHVFVTAMDIPWQDHVDMQATAQRFISNSVSKTINFPKGTTPEEIANAYKYAWANGCCGLTVYVDGSRDGAVLTAGK